MVIQQPKHILIAPLDWGLGHTARCVPVIRHIISLGHIPVVACSVSQRSFIEETFGDIEIIHLAGYDITYSKWNKWAQMGILSQLPRITKSITNEHKWLQEYAPNHKIDGIISDNRYGLFHPSIPSVIMTHQLQVQTGMGNLPDRAVQRIHYKYLGRFGATWVVDAAGEPNLANKLSHPQKLPAATKYIGLLSRFEGLAGEHTDIEKDTLLILLSGPEPQRTALSKMLWAQAVEYKGKVIFVAGSENATLPVAIPTHIAYHKRLADEALYPLLQDAAMVICRSGYSTLMDLVALNKKAILIPTPGQTEQEYLGSYLLGKGILYATKQTGFSLGKALQGASEFPYNPAMLQGAFTGYKEVIDEWLLTL